MMWAHPPVLTPQQRNRFDLLSFCKMFFHRQRPVRFPIRFFERIVGCGRTSRSLARGFGIGQRRKLVDQRK